jgi:superfamily II RNA helicase
MSDAIQDALQSLIQERGGSSRFDQTQLLIASKLAEMLVGDASVNASAVVALTGLLPAKPSAEEGSWNLELLTDEQFKTLDRLCAIARGEKPPSVEKPRRGPPRRSPREVLAHDLALTLDCLEAEQDAARKLDWKNVPAISDEDVQHVQNAISSLLGLVVTWPRVAEPWIDEATYPLRKELAERDAVARVHDVLDAPARVEPAPEPPPNNVVEAPFGVFRVRRQSIFEEPRW